MRQNITIKTMLKEINLSHTAIYRMPADGGAPPNLDAAMLDRAPPNLDAAMLDRAPPNLNRAPPNLNREPPNLNRRRAAVPTTRYNIL